MIGIKEIKSKIFKKENFYFLAIILFIFGIDRYSKIEIINNFSENSIYLIDFLNFDLVWNTGIGFGLMSSNSPLFYNLISIIIALVIIFLVIIGLKSDKFEILDKLDLEDYFIVSKAEKELSNDGDIKVEVKKASGQKCERCWKILEKKCQRESCPIK